MKNVKFETKEMQEIDAKFLADSLIQKANGSEAKWLAERRGEFWKKWLPMVIGLDLVAVAIGTVLFRSMELDPTAGIGLLIVVTITLLLALYPR